MYQSTIDTRGNVQFPRIIGQRVYMQPFTKKDGLPKNLGGWQRTIDQMLDGIDTDGQIYLMIDQGWVKPGTTQRRPGPHVDMIWGNRGILCHGSGWGHGRRWRSHTGHLSGNHTQGIVLASNVHGCVGYQGQYEEQCGKGGDCSHIDLSSMETIPFLAGKVYAGDSMFMLHEAVPIEHECYRTVVRLNVDGWTPH